MRGFILFFSNIHVAMWDSLPPLCALRGLPVSRDTLPVGRFICLVCEEERGSCLSASFWFPGCKYASPRDSPCNAPLFLRRKSVQWQKLLNATNLRIILLRQNDGNWSSVTSHFLRQDSTMIHPDSPHFSFENTNKQIKSYRQHHSLGDITSVQFTLPKTRSK